MTVLLGSSFKTVKAICTFARHLCDFLKGASAEKYREVQSTVRILNEVSTYVEVSRKQKSTIIEVRASGAEMCGAIGASGERLGISC